MEKQRANETKAQERSDGTCYIVIPAFVRDELGVEGGTVIQWLPISPGCWKIKVTKDVNQA